MSLRLIITWPRAGRRDRGGSLENQGAAMKNRHPSGNGTASFQSICSSVSPPALAEENRDCF